MNPFTQINYDQNLLEPNDQQDDSEDYVEYNKEDEGEDGLNDEEYYDLIKER